MHIVPAPWLPEIKYPNPYRKKEMRNFSIYNNTESLTQVLNKIFVSNISIMTWHFYLSLQVKWTI